jgi:hypothetical protein
MGVGAGFEPTIPQVRDYEPVKLGAGAGFEPTIPQVRDYEPVKDVGRAIRSSKSEGCEPVLRSSSFEGYSNFY